MRSAVQFDGPSDRRVRVALILAAVLGLLLAVQFAGSARADAAARQSSSTRTILNGAGVPSQSRGAKGDYYIDTAATRIYGPKLAQNRGGWGSGVALIGARGQNGANGLNGPAGAAGAAGAVGASGANGINGSQGPAGPVGLTGAAGIDGGVGATGITGVKGATGVDGVQGATGEQGVQGATGATGGTNDGLGAPSLWNVFTPYSPGSVVTYAGATWYSLYYNVGIAPGTDVTWALLADQGMQGETGATGATGANGDMGAQGATGDRGAQGDTGATGATGTITPPGGVLVWAPATAYFIGDIVTSNGSTWYAKQDNYNQAPGLYPGAWGLFAQKGVTGNIGPSGPQGAMGTTGEVGVTGTTGAVGSSGATGATGTFGGIKGPWNVGVGYVAGDVVQYDGSAWFAQAATTGDTPSLVSSVWGLLAAKGDLGTTGVTGATGATGSAGAIGLTGSTGAAGAIGATGVDAIGTTGAAGANGQNGATGTNGVTGPTGPQGPKGATGLAGNIGAVGATGTTGTTGATGAAFAFRNVWDVATNYGAGSVVAYQGSTWITTTGVVAGSVPGVAPAWELLAQVGATGSAGATGLEGFGTDGSTTGASGPITVLAGDIETATASCTAPGQVAISGGFSVTGIAGPAEPSAISSYRKDTTTWEVVFREISGQGGASFIGTANVVCATGSYPLVP